MTWQSLTVAKNAALIGAHISVERTGIGINDGRREVSA